ncbi:hypothetical protein LDO32_03760 [Luteimonas sp. Y-2-2-4F]|nr:hypothetical protein [Luteimonas sp. Y-2-2-4F]MCD9030850.1 hypothetical protein [Luteimonas sp. Y-2-2-4F]
MSSRLSGSSRSASLSHAVAAALFAGALLAGCSPSQQPTTGTAAPIEDTAPAPAPAPSTGDTVGGDGSEIRLDALTESDLKEADLSGELACSFSTGGAAPILYATGVVASDEAAQGVVKVAGYVERIGAPGGFDGILDDPTFTGQGKTIEIALTGPAEGGGESPPRPATLTYQRADGASRTFDGRWQCGP